MSSQKFPRGQGKSNGSDRYFERYSRYLSRWVIGQRDENICGWTNWAMCVTGCCKKRMFSKRNEKNKCFLVFSMSELSSDLSIHRIEAKVMLASKCSYRLRCTSILSYGCIKVSLYSCTFSLTKNVGHTVPFIVKLHCLRCRPTHYFSTTLSLSHSPPPLTPQLFSSDGIIFLFVT